ncbi:gluconolactonase, partial [Micromonospora chalcea]
MTWRPTIAALTGLCLALTTAPGPAGAAPPAPRRAAHVNVHTYPLAGPPGAPPGVCPGGTG